jgi:hypothetical protein
MVVILCKWATAMGLNIQDQRNMEAMVMAIIRYINIGLSIRDQPSMETMEVMVTEIIRDTDQAAITMMIIDMVEAMVNIGSIMIMINSRYRLLHIFRSEKRL